MNLKPFTLDEILKFQKSEKFVLIPRFLFGENLHYLLPAQSKLFYGVLLEKYSLCQKMNWIDEEGIPYIICHRTEMADLMCCDKNPILSIKKHLTQLGLLKTHRVGSRTYRIYLLHPEDQEIF